MYRSNLETIVNFLTNLRNSDWDGCSCAAPLSLFHYNDPWREIIALENIQAKGWLLAIQMKRPHTSSRKKKPVTEMSLSRIIFLFTWYLYAEFLRVRGRIASTIAGLLGSDMSVRVLSQQLWPKRTMRWAIFTGEQIYFQVKQAKTTCLLNFRALIRVVAVREMKLMRLMAFVSLLFGLFFFCGFFLRYNLFRGAF